MGKNNGSELSGEPIIDEQIAAAEILQEKGPLLHRTFVQELNKAVGDVDHPDVLLAMSENGAIRTKTDSTGQMLCYWPDDRAIGDIYGDSDD